MRRHTNQLRTHQFSAQTDIYIMKIFAGFTFSAQIVQNAMKQEEKTIMSEILAK